MILRSMHGKKRTPHVVDVRAFLSGYLGYAVPHPRHREAIHVPFDTNDFYKAPAIFRDAIV
jgi:hypothetical protein